MRIVLQRVLSASVTVSGNVVAQIEKGILVLVGIEEADNQEDIDWLANKIINLRIFNDAEDVMNLSINEVKGEMIIVSQFTLHAATKKGNRPSYIRAAKPDIAIPLYEKFIDTVQSLTAQKIQTGIFGADMQVQLINDGPVTIFIDTKNKE